MVIFQNHRQIVRNILYYNIYIEIYSKSIEVSESIKTQKDNKNAMRYIRKS